MSTSSLRAGRAPVTLRVLDAAPRPGPWLVSFATLRQQVQPRGGPTRSVALPIAGAEGGGKLRLEVTGPSGELLASAQYDPAALRAGSWLVQELARPVASGTPLTVELTMIGPGRVAPWVTATDVDPGTLTVNGRPQPGDLVVLGLATAP